MVTIKTPSEIEILRECGRRLARILSVLSKAVYPGVFAKELDQLAKKLISEGGDQSAFFGYTPAGGKRPYPAVLCVSVNNEVVHGIPNETEKILREGDIVSLDLGLSHRGLICDSAVTVPVGVVDKTSLALIETAKGALMEGISKAQAGGRVGDIGFAISRFVKKAGFGVVRDLSGHGVGYKVHEDPYVPNYGSKGKGDVLKAGMVIAIEPMVNEGLGGVVLGKDGFTYNTIDGKRSAHFEHTVVITEKSADILTAL